MKNTLLHCSIAPLLKGKPASPNRGEQSNNGTMKQFTRGFSLIELLVVIAIIGVLSAFLFAQFGGARERARDAQRKADLRRMQTALESFYQDNGSYPAAGATTYASTVLDILFTDGYIAEIPRDPNDDGTGPDQFTRYNYDNGAGCAFTTGQQTYRLWVFFENDDDPQATDSCGAHFSGVWSIADSTGDLRSGYVLRSP